MSFWLLKNAKTDTEKQSKKPGIQVVVNFKWAKKIPGKRGLGPKIMEAVFNITPLLLKKRYITYLWFIMLLFSN